MEEEVFGMRSAVLESAREFVNRSVWSKPDWVLEQNLLSLFKKLDELEEKMDPDYKVFSNIPEFKFCLRDDLKDRSEFLPTKSEPFATGWDVRCAEPDGINLLDGDYYKIRLGFRVFAPPGWWLFLLPRSSAFFKKHLHPLYGVVDNQFENEVCWVAQYLPQRGSASIEFGERIGQIIPFRLENMKVSNVTKEEYDELCKYRNGTRGTGGFGASGKM